ncbi:MAG: hypothetical protein V9G04_12850 [Nocardioides sp.]
MSSRSARLAPRTTGTRGRSTWTPDGRDPVLGIPRLKDAYEAREPGYPRGITVPAIVDDRVGSRGHQRLPADHP